MKQNCLVAEVCSALLPEIFGSRGTGPAPNFLLHRGQGHRHNVFSLKEGGGMLQDAENSINPKEKNWRREKSSIINPCLDTVKGPTGGSLGMVVGHGQLGGLWALGIRIRGLIRLYPLLVLSWSKEFYEKREKARNKDADLEQPDPGIFVNPVFSQSGSATLDQAMNFLKLLEAPESEYHIYLWSWTILHTKHTSKRNATYRTNDWKVYFSVFKQNNYPYRGLAKIRITRCNNLDFFRKYNQCSLEWISPCPSPLKKNTATFQNLRSWKDQRTTKYSKKDEQIMVCYRLKIFSYEGLGR